MFKSLVAILIPCICISQEIERLPRNEIQRVPNEDIIRIPNDEINRIPHPNDDLHRIPSKPSHKIGRVISNCSISIRDFRSALYNYLSFYRIFGTPNGMDLSNSSRSLEREMLELQKTWDYYGNTQSLRTQAKSLLRVAFRMDHLINYQLNHPTYSRANRINAAMERRWKKVQEDLDELTDILDLPANDWEI